MDKMMDRMIGKMSQDEKEKMMLAMMPMMMEDVDMTEMMVKMMPEMLKSIKVQDVLELLEGAFPKIAGKMSGLMFSVHKSKLNFDETVSAIENSGTKHGWYNPTIIDHYKIEKELGYEDATKVTTVSMCKPHSAHKILKEDKNKKLSIMMPMQISIYETTDGQVYVAWMNVGFMGKMFGGIVEEVMGEAAENLKEVHEGIIEE